MSLLSWGRYPPIPQKPYPCFWQKDVLATWQHLRTSSNATTLPYGAGLSYGDSCLAASNRVLAMRGLNHYISVDWEKGIITAEAGVTLKDILSITIPQGWFLSVTPGTQYITLGGAIANDVHGKNHHVAGTFGCFVRKFALLRSDGEVISCSPTENTSFFHATIGGLGLTGIILWAEIQLQSIGSSCLDTYTQRFHDLKEFFALSQRYDTEYDFCVSWLDCTATRKALGRGIYMAGRFLDKGPLAFAQRPKISVPLTPPFSLVNTFSLRVFNALYWRTAPPYGKSKVVDYDGFFYPLDSILLWNRIYGPQGFQQFQALIPEKEAEMGMAALLQEIAQHQQGSFLAVLKKCGDKKSPGLMSFPFKGTTLALDFPQSEHLHNVLLPRLAAIVKQANGRLYPAKDAFMSAEMFQSSYPQWSQLESLRDKSLLSRFWQRVTT